MVAAFLLSVSGWSQIVLTSGFLWLGLFILTRSTSRSGLLGSAVLLSSAWWWYCIGSGTAAVSVARAQMWFRVGWLGSTLPAALWLHLSAITRRDNEPLPQRTRWLVGCAYLLAAAFAISDVSGSWLVRGLASNSCYRNYTLPGPGYGWYAAFLSVTLCMSTLMLWQRQRAMPRYTIQYAPLTRLLLGSTGFWLSSTYLAWTVLTGALCGPELAGEALFLVALLLIGIGVAQNNALVGGQFAIRRDALVSLVGATLNLFVWLTVTVVAGQGITLPLLLLIGTFSVLTHGLATPFRRLLDRLFYPPSERALRILLENAARLTETGSERDLYLKAVIKALCGAVDAGWGVIMLLEERALVVRAVWGLQTEHDGSAPVPSSSALISMGESALHLPLSFQNELVGRVELGPRTNGKPYRAEERLVLEWQLAQVGETVALFPVEAAWALEDAEHLERRVTALREAITTSVRMLSGGEEVVAPSVITAANVQLALEHYHQVDQLAQSPLVQLEQVTQRSRADGLLPVDALRLVLDEAIAAVQPLDLARRTRPALHYWLLHMICYEGAREGELMWELGFTYDDASPERRNRTARYAVRSDSTYAATSQSTFKRLKHEAFELLAARLRQAEESIQHHP